MVSFFFLLFSGVTIPPGLSGCNPVACPNPCLPPTCSPGCATTTPCPTPPTGKMTPNPKVTVSPTVPEIAYTYPPIFLPPAPPVFLPLARLAPAPAPAPAPVAAPAPCPMQCLQQTPTFCPSYCAKKCCTGGMTPLNMGKKSQVKRPTNAEKSSMRVVLRNKRIRRGA